MLREVGLDLLVAHAEKTVKVSRLSNFELFRVAYRAQAFLLATSCLSACASLSSTFLPRRSSRVGFRRDDLTTRSKSLWVTPSLLSGLGEDPPVRIGHFCADQREPGNQL